MQIPVLILVLAAISDNGVNAKPPSRIIGGQELDITNAPYAVMIRHRRSRNSTNADICGGTIISNRHILTAAHCFRNNSTDPDDRFHLQSFEVMAGNNAYHSGVRTYEIEEVYSHANYTPNVRDGVTDRADIAVVKLKGELSFGPTQQSIKLARKGSTLSLIGLAYGWGLTDPKIHHCSTNLQAIMLKVYPLEDCRIIFKDVPFSRDEQCVVTFFRNGGVYHGDSGGPLTINGQLAGVITSGVNSNLGIISSVIHHKSWIEEIVKGTSEATAYSATKSATTNYNVQNLNSRDDCEKPHVHHDIYDLSSRLPGSMITEHDNTGKE